MGDVHKGLDPLPIIFRSSSSPPNLGSYLLFRALEMSCIGSWYLHDRHSLLSFFFGNTSFLEKPFLRRVLLALRLSSFVLLFLLVRRCCCASYSRFIFFFDQSPQTTSSLGGVSSSAFLRATSSRGTGSPSYVGLSTSLVSRFLSSQAFLWARYFSSAFAESFFALRLSWILRHFLRALPLCVFLLPLSFFALLNQPLRIQVWGSQFWYKTIRL